MENFKKMCSDARDKRKAQLESGEVSGDKKVGIDLIDCKDVELKDEQTVMKERKQNLKDMIAQAKAEKDKSKGVPAT
jgi:SLT domain-containing protein